MSHENTDPNAINPNPNPVDPNVPNPQPSIDPDGDRIKRDMLKYKDQNAQLQKQIDDLKLNGHKEKEDWKTVAEHHEQKSKDYQQKFEGLKDGLVNEKKLSALIIEAQKQGITPASLPDLELLDFDEVTVETTSTGKILVSGQDRAIAKLKTIRPHWFSATVPSVNPSTPNVSTPPSGVVSLADLNAAEDQYKKTKSETDKKLYYEMIQKYKTQRG